jgi:hypothetical protein
MESLKKFGQIQPILIERDGSLIAGFRRLMAATQLGWETIKAEYADGIDEATAREIELEENIRRLDMTWQERVRAVEEIHRLKSAKDPLWSQDQTAEIAGLPASRVSEMLKLSRLMKIFPQVEKADKLSKALAIAEALAKTVERKIEIKESQEQFKPIEERIILGDAVEVIKTLPKGQCRLVLTDPPFGIGLDKMLGYEDHAVGYGAKDTAEEYRRILSMIPDIYDFLAPDGWCIWFFGPTWFHEVKQAFLSAGFAVDEIPIIWYRRGDPSVTTKPDRYFTRQYDMAFHCIKGDPKLVLKGRGNVLEFPGVKNSEFLVERPVELYQELIRRLTIPGELVADFFAGTGSVLAAAASLQRRYLGVEIDPARRIAAIKKVHSYEEANRNVS